MTTNDVLMHHLTAFGNNDLVEILKDYTEESELLTPNGPLKGLEAIKGFFEDYFAVIPTGSAFEMKQLSVTGPVAYVAWTSESATFTFPIGTDTFFIQDEKIVYHTVADYRIAR
ncbi:nuclear transport factor 2 family protein [Dyadobacter psychrotolerans]|uniref:Nuclear transport factor 2 family protein n=1 Tax=Dyadobacter psychrotolerans TaxID=2541721 RepID=A0A4R5DP78_9BACT|nr:nuclear transport factor 2 family protein [Dyadobacter psychrotolerans]TDE16146.1 nuclear transport factor 2 family protein [Dyadobacter psychrotolerans]